MHEDNGRPPIGDLSGKPGRWWSDEELAAHDHAVAAKALRDAADEAQQGFVDEQQGIGFARVRTDWLRARADRIESQANEKGASDGEQ